MTTCRDLCEGKMSVAIRAMLDGLEAADARDDFTIDMSTFGYASQATGHCWGCAATCALMQITHKQFTAADIGWMTSGGRINECSWAFHARATGLDQDDVTDFELAIDHVRDGNLRRLTRYMQVDPDSLKDVRWGDVGDFRLPDLNWQDGVPAVELLIEELKAVGL